MKCERALVLRIWFCCLFFKLVFSSNSQLDAVIKEAFEIVQERRSGQNYPDVPVENDSFAPRARLAKRRETPEVVAELGFAADLVETSLNIYASRYDSFPDVHEFEKSIRQYCPKRKAVCNPQNRYRLPDGTCNNLEHPEWGASMRQMTRILPPQYGDKWNLGIVPRERGVNGDLLPSPRKVSDDVFKYLKSVPQGPIYNLNIVHFSLFILFDVATVPLLQDGNRTIRCCNGDEPVERPECMPVIVPPGDFISTCRNFVRSEFAPTSTCLQGPRNQMNMKTSYLDMSAIFGNTFEGEERFRMFGSENENSFDYLLSIYHVLFLRDIDYVTDELAIQGWSGDRLFREARKIVTGIYQHITYNEFLPVVIGEDAMQKYGLYSSSQGFNTRYNEDIDATTENSFSGAALRFTHGLVDTVGGSFITSFSPDTIGDYGTDVEDGTARIFSQLMEKADRFYTDYLRNRMVETMPGNGFDLAAIDVQRGRDHGLPPYNEFRKYCGFQPIARHHLGNGWMGLSRHEKDAARGLARAYSHPDDIDLHAGAMAEKLAPGAIVGPTYQCLIAEQFRAYRAGDRFFYENDFTRTGFTIDQLNEIKKQSLSSLFCRHTKATEIPKNPFVSSKTGISLEPCDNFPEIDFSKWSL